jgi:cell division protein FtsI (penicillin-binding protein 3)
MDMKWSKLPTLVILTFYNAVANNGKMMKPRFVKAIADHGQVIKEYDTEVINPSICSRSTIKKAHKMLEGVVEKGTAMNLKNPVYKIAGKTGTAQLLIKIWLQIETGGHVPGSFCGYFQLMNLSIMYCGVNAPSSSVYYGNLLQALYLKRLPISLLYYFDLHKDNEEDEATTDEKCMIPISKNGFYSEIAYVMNQLDIPVKKKNIKSEWVTTSKKDNAVELNNRMIPKNQVPNVLGMGAKDAVFILENLGLNVTMVGKGAVSQQSITPGSFFNTGDHIVIRLS